MSGLPCPSQRATALCTSSTSRAFSAAREMPLIMNADVARLDGLAPRACELCGSREGLLRCSACQMVYYCGRDCQAADRDDHRTPCGAVKKARRLYQAEETALRQRPPAMLEPGRYFEDHVGDFWSYVETRPYMRARFHMVDAMLTSYGTAGGPADLVETALDHLLDMMRLCSGDNLGVRHLVPALYIRLGRDQEAHDFVMGNAPDEGRPTYGLVSGAPPMLSVRDADALEDPDLRWPDGVWLDLSACAALLLIKVRVLLDLRAVQNAGIALRGAVPREIEDMVRGQLVGGGIVGSRRDMLLAGPDETARLLDAVKRQVASLHAAVDAYNAYFWDLLIHDPDAGILRRPMRYAARSQEEALQMLGYHYAAWYETPGAMDVLRGLKGEDCDAARLNNGRVSPSCVF
ncbi:uncharacterized protein UV8b_07632 [Ustilaginoidea virens]|uniref:MYND-type domain-containing protein n=1 Tax=Ustilaginoidea virens TaxID=1159556 RepID=A0A8E5MKZ8_USTVR|nr:uncharacterized protein UV8b_07632 [Ustilaginoidea virens]QUC23391.1 hypothetical protein UV8b_07632 [Ustilaginoidea virens]